MNLRDFLKTKFASVLMALALAGLLTATARLFVQKYEVKNEIAALERRVVEVNEKNTELSELSKYFETKEFAERQAREKLNLKKEGEYVVALPKSEERIAGESMASLPNWQKWFDYFFNQQ